MHTCETNSLKYEIAPHQYICVTLDGFWCPEFSKAAVPTFLAPVPVSLVKDKVGMGYEGGAQASSALWPGSQQAADQYWGLGAPALKN